jgi:hypothetical protein
LRNTVLHHRDFQVLGSTGVLCRRRKIPLLLRRRFGDIELIQKELGSLVCKLPSRTERTVPQTRKKTYSILRLRLE